MRQSWCESYRSGPETEVRVPRRALYGFDPTRLTEVRRERGLSRSDLGRLSSVTYNTVRNWETGESAPSPSTLERVAEVLGVHSARTRRRARASADPRQLADSQRSGTVRHRPGAGYVEVHLLPARTRRTLPDE
ncbi:helix-turn-helix domain-containing protein [Rhodococcus ruber]|uniref:helix-turn-helix domain-containing protein n=1 Tax=Rhodococcus ruber TaxID=1830 RepID=UPI003455213B